METKPYIKSNYETVIMTNPLNQLDYELYVAKPLHKAPQDGYSIIYCLDGNAMFETTAEITRLLTKKPKGFDPAIVVGIGYPGGELFNLGRRTYDLTTVAEPHNLPSRPKDDPWPKNGGADELLDFFSKHIFPLMEQRFHINKKKIALFGHSFGGLFVLHSLFTKPTFFTHYIASSSSIWWNNYSILQEYHSFKRNLPNLELLPKVLMVVGGNELLHMMNDSEELSQKLLSLHDSRLEVQFAKLADEDHVSVIPGAISKAVKFMLEK